MLRKVTIRLDDVDMQFVSRMGGGNVSDGIRQAIQWARDAEAAIGHLEVRLMEREAEIKEKVEALEKRLNGAADALGGAGGWVPKEDWWLVEPQEGDDESWWK